MPEKWVPKLGTLVARRKISLQVDEIMLCFREEPDAERKYALIAVMDDFTAGKKFSRFAEGSDLQEDKTDSGNVILRDYASDAVLQAFVKLWSPESTPLNDWIDEVNKCEGLSSDERLRLRQIVLQTLQ